MKFTELKIQTQRERPNNARTEGFAFLVRAGYLTRDNIPTNLGTFTLDHIRENIEMILDQIPSFKLRDEIYFEHITGDVDILKCSSCEYIEHAELATLSKVTIANDNPPLPLEKVSTPECNTIESLANFLHIPEERTAKALMYTRVNDGKFIFVVIRGDMQLSEAKLKNAIGDVRAATTEEIIKAGAVPGYASPVGLKDAFIVVDDLVSRSVNLVAGANQAGYHLLNTNHGRDYLDNFLGDLVQAKDGDPCILCGNLLQALSAIELTNNPVNVLKALAESHHDENGLTLPYPAHPFDMYLMHLAGKELDTFSKAEEIYKEFRFAGYSVLFDDRNERAGVKFNDADLIGSPVRVTVGEKGLKDGMVELKIRSEKEKELVIINQLIQRVKTVLI